MDIYQPLLVAFDPLLKPSEAAEHLTISKATLNKWRVKRRSYAPRALKTGSTLRFRVSDLDHWLRMRTHQYDVCQTAAANSSVLPPARGPAPARLTLPPLRTYWHEVLHRDPLLTMEETAQYLAIPKSTLYTHRSRDPAWEPPAVEMGDLRY